MNEIDYGALFGIDEGGKEQEAADPAQSQEEQAQGEEVQEAADPAEEDQDNTQQTTGADDQASEEDAGGEQPEGNTETGSEGAQDANARNAQFAAARRKAEAERDAAIAKAREDARAEAQRFIDEAFASSGMTNPYTKKPITSKAEYDEYRTRLEADRKARLLKKSGMSDDEFREFVQGLPEVKQAKEAQAAAETAARQAREQQAKLKVEEQLKEISALDPSIQELKDLAKMETYPKFYELVKRGNTLTDAFKLANYEALTGRAAAASRQAAINSAQGKQHLSPTTQRGAGAVSVPADVKAEYLAFNPDATDAEIQQHYNRYVKNHKK